MKAMTKK